MTTMVRMKLDVDAAKLTVSVGTVPRDHLDVSIILPINDMAFLWRLCFSQ